MRVGVPKEIKIQEYRVGLTPRPCANTSRAGPRGAGRGRRRRRHRRRRRRLRAAGARIVASAAEVFAAADMIVKVKEPQPAEWPLLRAGPDPVHLSASGARPASRPRPARLGLHRHRLRDGDRRARRPAAAGADERGRRPAGDRGRRAFALRKPAGGRACCSAACPACCRRAWWSSAAAWSARTRRAWRSGLGADVTIIDRSLPRLRQLDELFQGRVRTRYLERGQHRGGSAGRRRGDRRGADPRRQRAQARDARDAGAHAAARVLVDVAIDQGGCFETSHADDPRRADLRGGRHHPLLRGQHARRGAGAPRATR